MANYDPLTIFGPERAALYDDELRADEPATVMARLADLRLKERSGGWSGEPFTGESASHVSVYGF